MRNSVRNISHSGEDYVRTDVEICLLHHTLILYIQRSECLQVQSFSPVQSKLAAVVSDTVTLQQHFSCLGHSLLTLQSACGCACGLKAWLR